MPWASRSLPSLRIPVPASMMMARPFFVRISMQVVSPPYLMYSWPLTGMEPLAPQILTNMVYLQPATQSLQRDEVRLEKVLCPLNISFDLLHQFFRAFEFHLVADPVDEEDFDGLP